MALIKVLKFLNGLPIEMSHANDSLAAKTFFVGGSSGTELTKSILDTLSGGTNTDATSLHSHDSRYYTKVQHIQLSAGAADAAKPILSDARGKVDPSFIVQTDIDHGSISGLTDDDHLQYHTDARGDARYFQKSEFIATTAGVADAGKPIKTNGSGKIDATFIDSASSNHEQLSGLLGGAASDHYHLTGAQHGALTGGSATDASAQHNHNTQYYTKAQVDSSLALKADLTIVVKKDGSVAFTGAQSMGSNKLTNLADGTVASDAANKGQMDTADGLRVAKAGDSMSGDLTMTGGATIKGVPDPLIDTDAANKRYVDLSAQGFRSKAAVRALRDTNFVIATGGLPTVDGVALDDGDRVLLIAQTTASQNGIYVAHAGAWVRSTDADASAEVTAGMTTFISEGGTYGNLTYTLITDDPITLGTTALVFTETSRLGQIIAGIGLVKTGDTLDVNLGAGIKEMPSDEVGLDLHASGALETVNPGTGLASSLTDAQLAVKLQGTTLAKDASGLKVATSGITDNELAANAVITAKVANDAITDTKLADHATDDSQRAVGANHIKTSAVTTAKIADDAVDKTKIAADVAGAGLGQNADGSLEVNTDGVSLEVASDAVQIKNLGVTRAKIANQAVGSAQIEFGTGAGQVDATDIPVLDTADYFTGTTVEGTLGEIGVQLYKAVYTAGEDIGSGDLVCLRRNSSNQVRAYKASAASADNYVAGSKVIQDLTYTADTPSGNDISIVYINPGVINAALAVGVSGKQITVTLATDGSGALISTATEIKAAVDGNTNAAALVNTAITGTGANIQTAAAAANLTGGMDFNDNGSWEVFGQAVAAATSGTSCKIKRIGQLGQGSFTTTLSTSDIGKGVYLSINKGTASLVPPTGTNEAIVYIGRLTDPSFKVFEFKCAILRGVNG